MIAQKLFKFCPVCGKNFKLSRFNAFKCDSCGFEYFINPIPCNALLIFNSKKEVLLVERRFEPRKDMLDFPGGFVDIGENFFKSAVREAKEELGIDILESDLEFFADLNDQYDYSKLTFHTMGLVLRVTKTFEIDEMQAMDDAKSLKFYPVDRIPIERMGFESMKTVCRMLRIKLENE